MNGTKRYFISWVIGLIFAACGAVLSVFAIINPTNDLLMRVAIAFDSVSCGMNTCTFVLVLGRYIRNKKNEEDNEK